MNYISIKEKEPTGLCSGCRMQDAAVFHLLHTWSPHHCLTLQFPLRHSNSLILPPATPQDRAYGTPRDGSHRKINTV